MNALFISIYALLFILIFIFLPLHIWWRIRTGKTKQPPTYSYKDTFLVSLICFGVVLIVTILTHYLSGSFVTTISIGVLLTVCVIAALLRTLLNQQHLKVGGAQKKE